MDKIKLTNEIKTNFLKLMEEKGFSTFCKSINDLPESETGVFEVIITTEDTDRMGEVIQLDGWDLKNYMKNPVVLWGHDHYKMPIGICTSIERTATGLLARGKFAPGEEGQEVRQLYDLGIVRATSVGFIEKERTGNLITKAELIEFSFVSVPANPMALSTLIKSNINVNELVTKGFMHVETKDAEEKIEETDEKPEETEKPTEEIAEAEKEEPVIEEPKEEEKPNEENDNQEAEEDGEKTVKISKSTLKSIRLALKEATDALEDFEESSEEDEEEDPERIEEADEEGIVEDPDEKVLKHFTQGRKLAQIAATAIAQSLAEMRKAGDIKRKG